MEYLWMTMLALIAGVLSAVTGFGGAAILLPGLIAILGPRDAVVATTIAQIAGNLSRVWLNRKELDWRLIQSFSLGAVPASILGGMVFSAAPLRALTLVLGAALIAMVLGRLLLQWGYPRLSRRGFIGLGVGIGTVSGLAGTAGPVAAPFFLGYGLVRGAYIGTEAATALIMHLVKSVVYGAASVMVPRAVGIGLLVGAVLLVGSCIGKRVVDRLPQRVFLMLVEAALLVSGVRLLWT